jgi:hypothetical protein
MSVAAASCSRPPSHPHILCCGAGTFEERDWTEWAKKRLGELCKEPPHDGYGGGDVGRVRVTSITVDGGHANTWLVRGKKKCGFDFQVQPVTDVGVHGGRALLVLGAPQGVQVA